MKEMDQLYTKEFREIMKVNNDCTSKKSNRIEDIVNFAKGAGFTKIGIAHCISFKREAEILEKYLAHYFEVYRIDCKYQRIPLNDIIGGTDERIACNPAGQAEYLNEKNTDLNISMGLCVGHDMIFSKKSNAYVTNLFDKDFTNKHNTAESIAALKEEVCC